MTHTPRGANPGPEAPAHPHGYSHSVFPTDAVWYAERMHRRSFFGSLLGTAFLALASGTGLAQTSLGVSRGGRSRSWTLRHPVDGALVRRWYTWDADGNTLLHEVLVGEPGIDAPYLSDYH
jgi:hypothetical protein